MVTGGVQDIFHFPFQVHFPTFPTCSVLRPWLFRAILTAFLVHDLQLGLANGRHQLDTWSNRKQSSGYLSSRLLSYWVSSDWLLPKWSPPLLGRFVFAKKFYLYICRLPWVFVVSTRAFFSRGEQRLLLVAGRSSHCSGARLGSKLAGLSGCGAWARQLWLSGCGAQAQ